jgi:hypothetical protein
MRWTLPCLGALLALQLLACGSHVAHYWSAPEFDFAALESGQILVGAVVAVPELHREGHTAERAYTETLDGALRRKRGDLPLVAHGAFVEKLDIDDVDTILGRYRSRGSLDPRSIEMLSRLRPAARYVLLSRLENDDLRQSSATGASSMDDESIAYSSRYSVQRLVVVSFDIFDLSDGKLVWTAQLSKQDERTRQREHGRRYEDDPDEIQPSFQWSDSGGYPEAPEFLEILRSIFEDLSEQLPRS